MDPPPKLLIQMSGAPGSGKSTLANRLGRAVDGVVIDHDLIKSFFLDHGISFDHSSKLAYSFDWVLAEDMIKQGRSVIIDCTCNYDEVLDNGAALARKHGYDYWYVECCVQDIDLIDARLRTRNALRSQRTAVDQPPEDASAAAHERDQRLLFKRWIENPCRPEANAIVVDSTESPEKCVAWVLEHIGRSTQGFGTDVVA